MHEKTISSERLFEGRVVTLDRLAVELTDGRRSIREIVRHVPAVGVLARLPCGDFLFVRQYRKAVEEEILEVCAGCNDPGEAPEAAARRELREETGYAARRMEHLGRVYASPGYTDEVIDLFHAELADAPEASRLDADEHVETVQLTPAEVDDHIRRGVFRDAKTIAAWHLYRAWAGRQESPR